MNLRNLLNQTFRVPAISLLFAVQFVNLGTAQAHIDAVIGDVAVQANVNLPGFIPGSNAEEVLISRKQYVISYNKTRREPNWVAWKVEQSDLGSVSRSNNFQLDTELETYLTSVPSAPHAVDPTEYKGSCFDRGHQSPSGDHTATAADNEATFMMSNMIPQTAYLNRVIWEHLESYTRDLVKSGKKVFVIAGPIYDKELGSIGPNQDIPVPSKNFKLVYVLEAGQSASEISSSTPVISVIMPNVLKDGSDPTTKSALCDYLKPEELAPAMSVDDWKRYQTSVSEIEREAQISLQ